MMTEVTPTTAPCLILDEESHKFRTYGETQKEPKGNYLSGTLHFGPLNGRQGRLELFTVPFQEALKPEFRTEPFTLYHPNPIHVEPPYRGRRDVMAPMRNKQCYAVIHRRFDEDNVLKTWHVDRDGGKYICTAFINCC